MNELEEYTSPLRPTVIMVPMSSASEELYPDNPLPIPLEMMLPSAVRKMALPPLLTNASTTRTWKKCYAMLNSWLKKIAIKLDNMCISAVLI